MKLVNFPDKTSEHLAKLAEHLHEKYFSHMPRLLNRHPYHQVSGNKVTKAQKSDDGRIYTFWIGDHYAIDFASGRFGAETKYERDEPIISDRTLVKSFERDYDNPADHEKTVTRKNTTSTTSSRTVSAEQVFRALASADVGVEIKFVTAGVHTEAEYTTTSSESDTTERTDSSEEEIPIIIPPHSVVRYTESSEKVVSRQTVRATGVMDWTVHVDSYNVISAEFESLEQLHLFFNGQLSGFPFGRVNLFDARRQLWDWIQGNALNTERVPEHLLRNTLEIIMKTDQARTGVSKQVRIGDA